MNKDELIESLHNEEPAASMLTYDEPENVGILIANIVDATLKWAATGQEPFMHVQILTENYQDADGEFTEVVIEECTKDKNEAVPLYRYPPPRVVPEKLDSSEIYDALSEAGFDPSEGYASLPGCRVIQDVVRKQFGAHDE